MIRAKTVTLLIASSCVCLAADEADVVFVPYTLLTDSELEDQKKVLVAEDGYDDATAAELVRRIPELHLKFTEDDVRQAFAIIEPQDKRKSICGNTMMSGETEIVYLSPKSDQSVTVKYSTCYRGEGGLYCSPMSKYESHFFETPEQHFSLDDDVSLKEALKLLTIFRDHGLVWPSDWKTNRQPDYREVNHIGKAGIWYTMRIGEYYCRGCVSTLKVVIDAPRNKPPTLLVEGSEMTCI